MAYEKRLIAAFASLDDWADLDSGRNDHF